LKGKHYDTGSFHGKSRARGFTKRGRKAHQLEAIERLAEVRAPTLILVGDYDIGEKLAMADRLAAEIPSARKVVVHGAHIWCPWSAQTISTVAINILWATALRADAASNCAPSSGRSMALRV
jgi:pimeloyl-ACP methyl ester carboxylesterase